MYNNEYILEVLINIHLVVHKIFCDRQALLTPIILAKSSKQTLCRQLELGVGIKHLSLQVYLIIF